MRGRSCGCPTAGRPLTTEEWSAPGYWREIDGDVACADLERLAAGRSGSAGVSRQLLRSRRLRALGRQMPAERSGMGSGRARRRHRRCVRRGVAMDPQRLSRPIPAMSRRPARSANTTASSWSTRWCCAAPRTRRRKAIRALTYRNFFYPPARWQFTGLRLAEALRVSARTE